MSECHYTAVCTPGSAEECGRVKPGGSCLCPCHPDGLHFPKEDGWKPAPLHAKALAALHELADANGLEACDPGGECYFPRCLADGCEGEPRANERR